MMHPDDMTKDIETVLVPEEKLREQIHEMGARLTKEYAGKLPLFVGILKGCVPFFTAMTQEIQIPSQWDFISISSYDGTASTGRMTFRKDIDHDIRGHPALPQGTVAQAQARFPENLYAARQACGPHGGAGSRL